MFICCSTLLADENRDLTKQPTLYLVGYAHLDTQWRWEYPRTIGQFIPKTMHDNFALFEKYPHYIFNFSGANRHRMMKEYYPAAVPAPYGAGRSRSSSALCCSGSRSDNVGRDDSSTTQLEGAVLRLPLMVSGSRSCDGALQISSPGPQIIEREAVATTREAGKFRKSISGEKCFQLIEPG